MSQTAAVPVTRPLVECRGLVRIYKSADLEVVALQGLDLAVQKGETVAVVGRSGSGKTTLMNVLAAVDTPSAGSVTVDQWDLTKLSETSRAKYRRSTIGYVWQQAQVGLVPELNAAQNVQLPMIAAQVPWSERSSRTANLLSSLGLQGRKRHLPSQLSAGEQQRLALAVALANAPPVLLADEPTSQLDGITSQAVLSDLRSLQDEMNLTIVFVTHDPLVSRFADRTVRISDGRTSTETRWIEQGTEARSDELVIMDRTGRLQIPRKLLEVAGLSGLVRVIRHPRGVLIVPAKDREGADD